ncbi:MAG TPA: Crp/Fnr family transcriptional regulator [Solirubrobacteraceae bacterium]|jgi:CRP-like cAMP-binding protein
MAVRSAGAVSLLDVDPDLLEVLDSHQAEAARSRAVARATLLRPGDGEPWGWIAEPNGHLGLLVIDGLLTRNVTLLGRTTMELIGAGDILRPWDDAAEHPSVPRSVGWTVHVPTRVALLDEHLAQRVAAWPGIVSSLMKRSVQRAQWLEHHLAILENPRVDVRLLLLFWQLADRWGTVGVDGVAVPLRLTHKTLGRLVRAQRPSVTASLHELARRGIVERRRDGTWLLHGEPSRQLRLLLDTA